MFMRMLVSIQRTLFLKSCSSSLSMRDNRMTRHVVFSKEVERIRVLLSSILIKLYASVGITVMRDEHIKARTKYSCKLCLKDNILEHASLKHPTYIFNECQQKTRTLKHR